MPSLKETIEDSGSGWSKIFNNFIEILIIISIISFAVRTLPDFSDRTREFSRIQGTVLVIIFTIEYIPQIIVADNKMKNSQFLWVDRSACHFAF